ncbi:MAG TPA: T9SS type A sorting domain-containing protein [Ignavibacteriaceae bacterium]|nr:T9SS type A sorting domain-containing protein [Ignavibacteriaceae bacterium]
MKKYLVIISLIFTYINFSQTIDKVYFLTPDIGWISYSTTNYFSFDLYKTTDGGLSWNFQITGGFHDIEFVNDSVGYIVGPKILKTINGGNTWEVISGSEFYRVSFSDENNGVILERRRVFKTTNGGDTWINLIEPGYELYDAWSHDSNNISIVSARISVKKTTNGGSTWFEQYLPSEHGLSSIFYIDSLTGFVSSASDGTIPGVVIGSIFKTTDGGYSWHEKLKSLSLWKVFFINNLVGFAQLGFKTTDAGENWMEIDIPSEESFYYFFLDCNNGFAIAKNNYFAKSTDCGETWIQYPFNVNTTSAKKLINPFIFSLGQNYPNPFNPSTKIKYTLPKQGLVTIKVYDVLGKEISQLVNEEKPSGEYEVEFDGRKLSSGIYYYKIQAGEFVQTKKMVLMK